MCSDWHPGSEPKWAGALGDAGAELWAAGGCPLGLEMADNQWDPPCGAALGPGGQVWESQLSPGETFGQPGGQCP